jgi:hypothetical protein
MADKRRRQNCAFDRAGEENDGIEHELFVRIFAADAVLRITFDRWRHLSGCALILQNRTCCVLLRLRRWKYLETKK